MFLVDGVDFLLRTALAILRMNEQELLGCDSVPALYVALESLPTRMWPADKLLQVRTRSLLQWRAVLMRGLVRARRICGRRCSTRTS